MTSTGHQLVVIPIQTSQLLAKYPGKLKEVFAKTLAERLPDLKLTENAPLEILDVDFKANLLSSANAMLYKDI